MTEENATVPAQARTCSVLLIAMKKSIKMTPLGITSNSGVILTLQTERCVSAWVFRYYKHAGESARAHGVWARCSQDIYQ